MIWLDQPKRRTGESVVPMINVAFLLLIFFLMVAVIAPPDPVAVTLPEGATDQDLARDVETVLFVAADGALTSQDGQAASFAEVVGKTIVLRADGAADASRIASIIAQVSAGGARSVQLAVAPN